MRVWKWASRLLALFLLYRAIAFGVVSIVDGDGSRIALSAVLVPFALAFTWLMWQMDRELRSGRPSDGRSSAQK